MKYRAVHDKKSVLAVAFLGIYSLICESEEKEQNNVSDDILQYLQTELLGLVKTYGIIEVYECRNEQSKERSISATNRSL